eukprot:COSAG01_NODE_2290_length_7984_cov_10.803424_7_plen_43_part_00
MFQQVTLYYTTALRRQLDRMLRAVPFLLTLRPSDLNRCVQSG